MSLRLAAENHFDKVNSHMSKEDREYFKNTGLSQTMDAFLAGAEFISQELSPEQIKFLIHFYERNTGKRAEDV